MLFNSHVHTLRSHDSSAGLPRLCAAAAEKQVSGLLITDHCDCEYAREKDYFAQFGAGEKDFRRASAAYGNQLILNFGIELGDPLYAPDFAAEICASRAFDAIMLSVHAARVPGFEMPFSQIRFSDFTDDAIDGYLSVYFSDLLESVRRFDFDILAHLTVPLRYIRLKYGRQASCGKYMPVIEEILRETAKKNAALEINTSAFSLPGGFFMPDEEIARLYIALGGRYFTVGSDAHTPDMIDAGLRNAHAMLRGMGVKNLCRFKNRQRLFYDI